MTAEAQYADQFMTYSATVSNAVDGLFTAHPVVALGVAGAVFAGAFLLHSPSPSIHPSATTRVNRVESRRLDRRLRGGSGGRPQRVDKKQAPPPKVFTVPKLVPHGPLPRWHWRWGLPPWGWERRGYVTTALGVGGVGKSFVLLDLGLAALTGGDWFGLPVRPARCVLYVDAELDVEECERRAHPLARGRGFERPPAGMHYLNITGYTLAPVKEKAEDGSEVEWQPGIERMLAAVRRMKHPPDLILLDSITIGSPGATASDEKAWNRIYSALETFGCPVVAIDHMDKAGKGAYGSMMKQAKVRSSVKLTRRGECITVEHEKHNFSAKHPTFAVFPEFGDEEDDPDYIVRFGTEPPSIHQEPEAVDGPVDGPTPLRLVPPAGKLGTRMAILGWIKGNVTEPTPRQEIVKAIEAAGLFKPATTQLHLKAMLEDGTLAEVNGALRLGDDPVKEQSA